MVLLLVVADFSSTVSLGTVVVGVLVVIFFGLGTFRDRQSARWRDLYDLADKERKELSAELHESLEAVAEQKEIIARLDALQMPTRVVAMMTEGMEHLDREAAERQTSIMEKLDRHEQRALERHEASLNLIGLIADRLGPDPNGH